MKEICSKKNCTGCYACYNICPKKCIEMKEDDNGYVYPLINQQDCINCGRCKKICPQNNRITLLEPKKAYAMVNKEDKIRSESTSGGAATTFYLHILNKNGVVYGANNIYNEEFNFIKVEKKEDLYKLKGSKYVHCYIGDIFNKIKEDLLEKKEVLFIGTPCQVAGLKQFLVKDYNNLITIDLVCHGVPPQKYLIDEIKNITSEKYKVNKVVFRGKGDEEFALKLYKDNELKENIKLNDNYYYKGFMDALFYRENCYSCKYATNKRVSDITIGDFWGLGKDSMFYPDRKEGVSVILPITQKGIDLLEECKDNMLLEERSINEAINGNAQLNTTTVRPKNYDKFKKLYLKYGFRKSYEKSKTLKQKMKDNHTIMKFYKLLKGVKK